jgi:hypothetical protein
MGNYTFGIDLCNLTIKLLHKIFIKNLVGTVITQHNMLVGEKKTLRFLHSNSFFSEKVQYLHLNMEHC